MKKSLELHHKVVSKKKFPAVVYGLRGIMMLFNVSKSTAFRYRHHVIADACTQRGNTILVDTKMALKLFGVTNVEDMVMSVNDVDSGIREPEIENAEI